jgi:phenylalanyl-tRNA synthetase alpha chain
MFHQMEGLAIGEGITLADLQGTLEAMLSGLFGAGREARMRPHFFPFTEPSVEFDVSCHVCDGTGEVDGERCSLCKGVGWVEVGGAGMVDPNVLGFVADNGYDSDKVQGFAFGFGIERMAMLLHGLPDLRLFVESDVRVLEQFS